MRPETQAMYVVMAAWSIIGAAARIVLQLTGSQPLDPLPFISALLGAAALTIVFTRTGGTVTQVVYTVMAVWLIIAPVVRFVLAATSGRPVDVIPFITATIGVTALVLRYGPRARPS